jgi:hypothetical protein
VNFVDYNDNDDDDDDDDDENLLFIYLWHYSLPKLVIYVSYFVSFSFCIRQYVI